MSTRGATLAELLVATLLTAVLAILVGGIVATAAVRLRDRSEGMALEHALRVSLEAGRSLLEPLGADSSAGADLLTAGPSGFVSRVTRAAGVLCGVLPDRVLARSGPEWWQAVRAPVAGRDSLLLATVQEPYQWKTAGLNGSAAEGVCPDGTSALVLPTALSATELSSLGPGSPIRIFEPVEVRMYASSAAQWIGIRLAGTEEAIQPLAGPFTPESPGFTYQNPAFGNASDPAAVVVVGLELEGITERAGGVGLARLPGARTRGGALQTRLRGVP